MKADQERKAMNVAARLAMISSLCLWICGCGSGGTSNGPMLKLSSGNWQFNMLSTTNLPSLGLGGSSLSQTGTAISGVMHLEFLTCLSVLQDIDLNGTVDGQTLQLNSSAVNGETLAMKASGSSSSLTGSYTLSGAVCAPDQGTFTATLVPPATGTWQGTLTSNSGAVTQVTATLTQTGPDAHGFFSVAGTATFNGPCLSSLSQGTIRSSIVSGADFLMIVSSNSLSTGGVVLISGTMSDPSTANTLTGIYTSNGGCVDAGKASLSKQ